MDKVVHFEIPADDAGRAQKFYGEVFDWKITKVPDMDYHMVMTVESDDRGMPKAPGAINGGMMKRSLPGEQPVVVISVSSVDNYLKKVEKAGGKVVLPKTAVGKFGLYARFSDTEKNIVGLWQDLK